MRSTCLAFTKLSIALYLSKCWEFLNNNSSIHLTIPTILHSVGLIKFQLQSH